LTVSLVWKASQPRGSPVIGPGPLTGVPCPRCPTSRSPSPVPSSRCPEPRPRPCLQAPRPGEWVGGGRSPDTIPSPTAPETSCGVATRHSSWLPKRGRGPRWRCSPRPSPAPWRRGTPSPPSSPPSPTPASPCSSPGAPGLCTGGLSHGRCPHHPHGSKCSPFPVLVFPFPGPPLPRPSPCARVWSIK